jgi:hypothetical protein
MGFSFDPDSLRGGSLHEDGGARAMTPIGTRGVLCDVIPLRPYQKTRRAAAGVWARGQTTRDASPPPTPFMLFVCSLGSQNQGATMRVVSFVILLLFSSSASADDADQ